MTVFLFLLCAIAAILLMGGYYTYRIAFYSPKKGRDKISTFASHKYDPYRKEINRLFCQLSDRPYEEVSIESFDGLTLFGRYYHVKDGAPLDMSFSGLKTAVVNLAHNAQQKGEPLDAAALARDFTRAVSNELVPRAMRALELTGRKALVAAGGVAANSIIRADLQRLCEKRGVKLYLPPLKWCGDNGAMIGAQGYYEYMAGVRGDMTLNGYATMELDKVVF